MRRPAEPAFANAAFISADVMAIDVFRCVTAPEAPATIVVVDTPSRGPSEMTMKS